MKKLYVLGRIHIPIIVLPLLLLVNGAALAADPPKVLIVANDGGYSTRLFVVNNSDSAASFTYKEMAPTPTCYNVTVAEPLAPHHGAVYTSDKVCDAMALIAAPLSLDVRSIISFDNGKNQSSFVVGPLSAVTIDKPSVVRSVISDEKMQAYITGFATEHTALTVEVFDGDPAFGAQPRAGDPETIEVSNAGPFQYRLKAQGVVYLRVSLGYKQLGLMPSRAPVYGFVSNATPHNGNSIISLFGE